MSEKFIIFSDLHVHNHAQDWRRVDDALEVLDWIKQEAIERGINKIFFLGDFFHVRGYMYPTIVSKVFSKLMEFKEAGVDMMLLIGNHDMPFKHSTAHNTLTAFNSIFPVIEQPQVYEADGYNFWFLPYIEDSDHLTWAIDELYQRAGNASSNSNTPTKNVLLAHLDIKDAKLHGSTLSTHGVSSLALRDKFDMIITGHYHINQQVDSNIYYVGSPYQQNFGEAGQRKGFYIFDDGEMEYVENTFSPKYIHIKPEEIDQSIKDQYVKITATTSHNIADIRRKANEMQPRSVSIDVAQNPLDKDRGMVNLKSEARDVAALLSEWVGKNANPKIYDVEKLLNTGKDIVKSTATE